MDDLLVCQTLGPQLMKLLGIPEHCASFELRCAAGEIVTVKCEFHPVGDDGKLAAVGTLMGEYKVVPLDAPAPREDAAQDWWGYFDLPLSVGIYKDPSKPAASCIGFDAWMRARTEAAHDEYMERTRNMGQGQGQYAGGGMVTGTRLVGEGA